MALSDFILELDSVKGESKDEKFAGHVEIQSFSWGLSNAGSHDRGTGGGSGKGSFQDLHFAKYVDLSSPTLALKCATGEHIAKAVLHVRKAGGEQKEYYTVTLTDLIVSSFQASAGGGDSNVMDQVSLNFAKIEWDYKPQDEKGNLGASATFGYDIKIGKKV
ncbi:type VI secretion system tube protein Hcp [Novosphingobium sp. Chol11]|uniref:Hcp family type VI secretion system effector n=1 Tax=Novosphingobium sp. Chol11 TaxID=1385763 RepID=UPI0025FD375E|nr:type VI secretion system tube protein Hcp [Novosphingobium sp. Chol11]